MRTTYGLVIPSCVRDDGSMVGEVVGWRLGANSAVKVYFPKDALLPGRRVVTRRFTECEHDRWRAPL